MTDLPGKPWPVLDKALDSLPAEGREAMREHLLGTTSAEYLSDWFARWGSPVSASTIRTYRRSLQQPEGSV